MKDSPYIYWIQEYIYLVQCNGNYIFQNQKQKQLDVRDTQLEKSSDKWKIAPIYIESKNIYTGAWEPGGVWAGRTPPP